jgi:hypothetical protein
MKSKKILNPKMGDNVNHEEYEANRIDDDGSVITDQDVLDVLNSFARETKIINEGDKIGLKTYKGEVILPPQVEDLYKLTQAELEKGDRVVAKLNGKWGVILADGIGTWLIKPEFDYIGFPNELTHVCKGGKWGVLDIAKNEYLIPPECETVHADRGFMFTNGIGFYEKDGKTGVVTEYGAFTGPVFEDVDGEPDGWVKVKYNGQWGFVNQDNQFTPDVDKADYRYES